MVSLLLHGLNHHHGLFSQASTAYKYTNFYHFQASDHLQKYGINYLYPKWKKEANGKLKNNMSYTMWHELNHAPIPHPGPELIQVQ